MPTRLYPPQINGTLPAFYKSYDASTGVLKDTQIVIPFTASALVSEADIVGFSLRLKTSSTNTYLFEPVESTNYDIANSTVTFTLPSSKGSLLNEGQYYKVQIAYISKYTDEEIVGTNEDGTIEKQSVFKKLTGYYSTVGIIKCVQKPSISIKGYSVDSINLFNNEIFGLYELSSDYDQTEKVYSYNFSFYTEDGELYYSTGELLHNNSNDNEYGLSIDSVILSSFIKTSEVYKLTYTVTTINGLVASSPMYRVTAETLLPPSKNLSIATTPQPDSGSIKINFQGNEHITRQENVVQEMVRQETYYRYDESLKRKLKKFYYGSDTETNNPKIKNYVTRIRAASYLGMVREYRQYLKDNLALLNEMCGISTGILESFFDTSTEYMLYLGDYLGKVIDNIGQKNESRNYEALNNQFLKDTATYIITLSDGYIGLTAALKRRLDSYISYLLDLIDKDETFIDSNVEDQTMLTLSQTVVSTVELSTELALEYLSILGYKAKIVYEEEKSEDTYFGQYMLVRASEEDDYRSWMELKRFKLENMRPSLVNYVDYTVKQGVKYIYGIVQYNLFGIYSSRIESDPVSVDFEDIFLYDGERVLKVKFNPKVSSFKTTILEQKTNTIGNKYPFIFRNGNVAYKEFPISGLISYQMDDELLFYDYEINEYFRECTENSNRSNSEEFFSEMAQLLENPCDLIENNIHKERDFKTEVLDWLNNGKPKLFKSGPEGNFIVRIMNVSLSPIDTLGRMLHSFSGQCAEIAEFNYDNLLRYGFIKADVVNKYVSLWKSYYLNEYEPGKDIELFFESSISNFSVQDLKPGSSIFLTYGDVSSKEEDEIVIGITGAYSYDSSRLITKIRIPNSDENHPIGILECQYQGTRYGAFDAITSMSLKTILSNQFVGVDPVLDELTTFSSQSRFLTQAEVNQFNNAIKSINDRIVLNDVKTDIVDIYNTLNKKGFEAGDIVQHINASFYNYEKSKIRILNLEQLKIRTRELIPIYAVPYDYINRSGWNKLPNSVTYWVSNGVITGECKKQLDGSYSRNDYENWFPSQNLLYSVTPFGEPFPIDELTPIVQKYFDINDEFCVFHLYEYFPEYDIWMPTQRKNIFGVKTGEYYDCYWSSIINDYDTSYYIDDKYRYEKINEILYDEETGEYYTLVQGQKKVFSDNLDLFVKFNGEYVAANNIYYFPTYNNEDGLITYYTHIKNDDSRIDDIEYLSQSVRWLNKENYNPVPGYYHNDWTIDENNRAKSIVREADIKDFYLRYENAVLLEDGQTAEFTNLGSPSVIKIGTGLIAEATFQLEILDYYTEKNNDATFVAKEDYTTKADFLRNFYRNFELIAEADSSFQRYLTLARMYRTLLSGLVDKDNYPYENTNTYQSNYGSNINYQDRSIANAILNSDKPGEDQNIKIAEVWSESDLPENTKLEIKQKVNETISRMQINKGMKTALDLQDEEEDDLYDLIQSATKEGINAKLGKLNELYQMLSESKNKTVSEGQTYASDYAKLLSSLKDAIYTYNSKIYDYKAAYWLYCLIYWKIGKVITKEMPAGKVSLEQLTYEEALELESKISINDILISIRNHYNRAQNAGGTDSASAFAEVLNIQKNYYIAAWGKVKTAISSILTYTSIINDKQGDSALDKLLLDKIVDNVYNILLYYWQMKNARDNLYNLLGVSVPNKGEDELFIKQIGLDGNAYYFDNVKSLIQSIENLIVSNEDVSQPTPKTLFETGEELTKELVISHNLLQNKLQMYNNQWGFSDEEIEEIKAYIKDVDKLDYITSAADDLGWSHNYYNEIKPNPANVSKEIIDLIPTMVSSESNADLYQLAVVFRERILNAFYYQGSNSFAEAYIATISSSGQASIKGDREIIPDTDDDIIDDGDSDLYISNDFDKVYQSIEDRSIKARKITSLLKLIDNLKLMPNNTNYREVLDTLSLQISSTANDLAPLVSNCYTSVLGTDQNYFGELLKQYNNYIVDCQTNLLKNADWQDYYEVENLSAEDYQKFIIDGTNHWYLDNKGQVDSGTYSMAAHYYLQLKDYLLFKFIKYYTGLNLADKDRLSSFAEYYNILVSYLTDNNLLVGFDPAEENSLRDNNNSFQFDNANLILAEQEVKAYNTLLEQSIEYDNNSRQTFIGAVVSGNNAFRDLPQIVTNFNNINATLLNKLLFGYKTDTLHKPFINGKDSAISGLTKEALTIIAAEDSNLNYLLVLDRVIKTVGLYYWANVSRFEEYDLPLLQMEFYTNTSTGASADMIDDNYSSIAAMGIIYWYLQYVVNKDINALEDALKQAEVLNIIYTNKQTNYQQKQEQYENLYSQYLEVYKNFLGTDYFEYYNSSADKKDALMRDLIQSVKNAWNEFVLALDRGYTAEVKAGMYQ